MDEARRRRTLGRPARFDRAQIAGVAIALADESVLDHVTMRSVAARLGSATGVVVAAVGGVLDMAPESA